MGFAVGNFDPLDLARRDAVIGALLALIAGGLIVVGYSWPEYEIASRLGSPLLAAAFGATVSGFWSARIAKKTNDAVAGAQAQSLRAIELLAFKDNNLGVLSDEHRDYNHIFWRSEGGDGPVWRYTEVSWASPSGLPVATASAEIFDMDGNRRVYDFLMQICRGKIVVFVTGRVSGEPTGVAIVDAAVLNGRLYGVQRHLTWANNERLSPVVIATSISAKGLSVGLKSGTVIDDLAGKRLDDEWCQHRRFDLNFPV